MSEQRDTDLGLFIGELLELREMAHDTLGEMYAFIVNQPVPSAHNIQKRVAFKQKLKDFKEDMTEFKKQSDKCYDRHKKLLQDRSTGHDSNE